MFARPVFVFDIGGTLLDSTGTLQDACTAELAAALGPDSAAEFATTWEDRVGERNAAIIEGEVPWAPSEHLRREELASLLPSFDLAAEGAEFEALKDVGFRSRAFTDAAAGLDQLAQRAHVVGLTNTDLAASSASCARAGLQWHALFSTEEKQTLKPRPEAYLLPEERLSIDPTQSYFVAAHPWDLRGAAGRGYRTVYIPRPHADGPRPDDAFDVTIETISDLIDLVRAGACGPATAS